jgi:hypothetical protein
MTRSRIRLQNAAASVDLPIATHGTVRRGREIAKGLGERFAELVRTRPLCMNDLGCAVITRANRSTSPWPPPRSSCGSSIVACEGALDRR